MRRFVWALAAGLLGLALAAGSPPAPGQKSQNQNQNRNRNRCSLMQELRRLPPEHLDEREALDLVYLVEEEKLARDVYLSAFESWQLHVFRRIAGSERSHMVWAGALVKRYELEDPIGDNGLGVFSNPRLQRLYRSFTELAADSENSALLVAASIEAMDIEDLETALESSDNADLHMVYRNLLRGSRNHLRAFGRSLAQREVTFEPESMSREAYLELIESPFEGGFVDAAGDRLCGGAPPG